MDKKKIEILIAIIVILGLVIALVIIFWKPKAEQPDTPGVITTPAETMRVSEVDSNTLESPPDVIARSFVERFGSYSTDVDYENVEDVTGLSTASLASRLEALLTDARNDPDTGYYGVSTQVLSIETLALTEAIAELRITTQRVESFDTPANTSSRLQDIEVTLTKNGTRWLVDDYTWIE